MVTLLDDNMNLTRSQRFCTRSKFIVLIVLFVIGTSSWAQQAPQYSLTAFNPYQANFAYAGFDGTLTGAAVYRSQWNGLAGSPESQWITGHAPVYRLRGALGASLHNESLGVEQNLRLSLSYNHVREMEFGYLSAGIQLGAFQKTFDGSLLRAREGIYRDGSFSHNDPALVESQIASFTPFAGVAFYVITDLLEGGIQWSNLLAGPLTDNSSNIAIDQVSDLQIFLQSQYEFSQDLVARAAIQLKSDLVMWQSELHAWAVYRDMYGAGLGYRGINGPNADAIVLLATLRLGERWVANYAYDLGLSSLNSVHSGSHEIMVVYNLGRRIGEAQRVPVIHNPRFLD